MIPSQLTAESFASYPPMARGLAVQHLALIRKLPLAFAALLMREVIAYDWLFPAERRAVDDQLAWLASLSAEKLTSSLDGFAFPSLVSGLHERHWVDRPAEFLQEFTALLWSSHQIDTFRVVAGEYAAAWRKAYPERDPPTARLAIAVLGEELRADEYRLFRKMAPHGVSVPFVNPAGAWAAIMETVAARAEKYPIPYGHWYIDGGSPVPNADQRLNSVSWSGLHAARSAILARMRSVIASGHGGPEELRTVMAETTPKDMGAALGDDDQVLGRFKLSILSEGSGTQIFSTTFVQWTAREALRRAQPCTLLLRFAPRQRQLPMNELLAGTGDSNGMDPAGSLMDADMGAYYTWIDQQRLSGADGASFIAWSEARKQAVVIGPAATRGVTAGTAMTMRQILEQFV